MSTTEQYRRECEARYWLVAGYNSKEKVSILRRMIAVKRGERAAEYLIEEMRRQFALKK